MEKNSTGQSKRIILKKKKPQQKGVGGAGRKSRFWLSCLLCYRKKEAVQSKMRVMVWRTLRISHGEGGY